MFRSIFRPYGPVWNFCNHITDVLCLSLLWCLFCLPVITFAPATVALYDAVVHGIRYGEEKCYARFLKTFRSEWKTGSLVTLLWGSILLFGAWMLALLDQYGTGLMAGAYRVLMLLPLTAACWSVILLSRIEFRFGQLTLTALQYLPAHLLPSAAIAAVTWAVCWYCTEYPIGLTFAPAVCALLWSFPAEAVLKKYNAGIAKPAAPEE